MQSLSWLTLFLCLAWTLSLLYGEMIAYWLPLWNCSWPHGQDERGVGENRTDIAVIADPQLMDRTSLHLPPRSFALETAKFYTDLYMRRAFLASILPFHPDSILFLGDQFDGGFLLKDKEWQDSLYRFKYIFDLSGKQKISGKKVFYLSGNHDIGYAGFHSLNSKVISRYEEGFGKRNYYFTVQGVDFIVIDAQTLDGHEQGDLTLESWKFIENVSEVSRNPKVLLSHIPLYRSDNTPCGPRRASPAINQRISYAATGVSYQNYLTEKTSKRLLNLVKPVLILSGHDHDQCTITHTTPVGPVTENTLGTVSWQQGNLYPSFMLLSVISSASSKPAVYTNLCFLPMQTHLYIWYAMLFIITIFLLASWPTGGLGFSHIYAGWISTIKEAIIDSFSISKEKNEDEDCEYEMIWDAEGSIHLLKKAGTSIPSASPSNIGLMGRSNVIARPQARKLSAQDASESSVALEVNAVDDAGKPRPTRSKFFMVVQRVIRVIRLFSIIATVNFPLYVMLLFKDWIDR